MCSNFYHESVLWNYEILDYLVDCILDFPFRWKKRWRNHRYEGVSKLFSSSSFISSSSSFSSSLHLFLPPHPPLSFMLQSYCTVHGLDVGLPSPLHARFQCCKRVHHFLVKGPSLSVKRVCLLSLYVWDDQALFALLMKFHKNQYL